MLLQRLTHPRYGHKKVYRVRVNKPLTPELLTHLEEGIRLQPEDQLARCQVQAIQDPKTVILVLTTGLNRQIRRMLEATGYEVTDLKRTHVAHLALGRLRPGQWRDLRPRELQTLQPPSVTLCNKKLKR
jgi:23S rRNA pseudouridine2604 synthase